MATLSGMLIANHEARIYNAIHRTTDEQTKKPVDTTRIRFMPGLNEVDEEDWQRVAGQAGPRRRLQSGQLEVIEKMSKVPVKAALDLARLSAVVDTLKKWRSGEKRKTVQEAIDKQIGALEDKEAAIQG